MKNLTLAVLLFTSTHLFAESEIKDSLTLFVYPPRHELNWSTPRHALFSFLGIEVEKIVFPGKKVESINPWGEESTISTQYRSTMGHSIAHIKCTTSDGSVFDDWSSFSGQDFVSVDKKNILKDKIGLGILFYDYNDGHVIRGEENINRLIFYKGEKKNHPRYLQMAVGTAECDQLKQMATFFESFHYKIGTTLDELNKRDPSKVLYFTTNLTPYESYQARLSDPSAKVGGGCAPYAVGLMKAASLYDDSLDSILKLEVDVSTKLMGTKDHPVTLASLIAGKNGRRWTYEGIENRHMSQYDPQKIWDFIGNLEECVAGDKCSLESNSWYSNHRASFKKGSGIVLKNEARDKEVEIQGIVLANP